MQNKQDDVRQYPSEEENNPILEKRRKLLKKAAAAGVGVPMALAMMSMKANACSVSC